MLGENGAVAECWKVSCIPAGPGGPWAIDDFQADVLGSAFAGMVTTGIGPATCKRVGTRIDAWRPTAARC